MINPILIKVIIFEYLFDSLSAFLDNALNSFYLAIILLITILTMYILPHRISRIVLLIQFLIHTLLFIIFASFVLFDLFIAESGIRNDVSFYYISAISNNIITMFVFLITVVLNYLLYKKVFKTKLKFKHTNKPLLISTIVFYLIVNYQVSNTYTFDYVLFYEDTYTHITIYLLITYMLLFIITTANYSNLSKVEFEKLKRYE